jgi:hypothetical protein
MADSFEVYARGKIATLRAEADQLERVLTDYLAERGCVLVITPTSAPRAVALPPEPRRRGNSAFGKVMGAVRAAGAAGMSLDEMAAVAEREGASIPRNTLRSQVWHEKTKGRLIALAAGRYAAAGTNLSLNEMLDIIPASSSEP